jgi:hypothetical protein
MRLLSFGLLFGASACASTTPPPETNESGAEAHPSPHARAEELAQRAEMLRKEMESPVMRGEIPWWHTLKNGLYRYDDEVVVLAIGDSRNHHHITEGFLHAKVNARLAVRKASEPIQFPEGIPEPELLDLFLSQDGRFLALYAIHVPPNATVPREIPVVRAPELLKATGRRRVGRHVFEGERHLYLECDIEGPIANPDWGRARAAARG